MSSKHIVELLFNMLSYNDNFYIKNNGVKYRCIFLYHDEKQHNKYIFNDDNINDYVYGNICQILLNDILYKGYFVYKNKPIEDTHSYELINSDLLYHNFGKTSVYNKNGLTFPFSKPIRKIEHISNPKFDNDDLTRLSQYQKQYFTPIFNLICKDCNSTKSKIDSNITIAINLYNEYKNIKMEEIMQKCNRYTIDSISSCCFLCIPILLKYKDYPFNWKLVTLNNAIHDRDILLNPNLPWNLNILLTYRRLPNIFYIDRFNLSLDDIPYKNETCIWSEMDLLVSPQQSKYDINIHEDEDDININNQEQDINNIDEIVENIYKDIKIKYDFIYSYEIESLEIQTKEKIKNNILSNGYFSEDEFFIPLCDFDKIDYFPQQKSRKNVLDDTIIKLENGKSVNLTYIEMCLKNKENMFFTDKYQEVMGIDISYGVKTLDDYEKILSNDVYFEGAENCIYFKREHLELFPTFFSNNTKNIRIKLGEISLIDILKDPYYRWDFFLIVKYLPLDDVFNYFLFWPSRVYILHSKSKIIDEDKLLKMDIKLKKIFICRDDFRSDYRFVYQYPNINWFSSILYYIDRKQIVQNNTKGKNTNISNSDNVNDNDMLTSILSWGFLKTTAGNNFLELESNIFDSLDDIEKDHLILGKILIDYKLYHNICEIIPQNLIDTNINIKFLAPQYPNISNIAEYVINRINNFNLYIVIIFLFYGKKKIIDYLLLYTKNTVENGIIFSEEGTFLYEFILKMFHFCISIFCNTFFGYSNSNNDKIELKKIIVDWIEITDLLSFDVIKDSIYSEPNFMFNNIINNITSNL